MANGSILTDLAQAIDAVERQVRCLHEYLLRGDFELAFRLASQLTETLANITSQPR